MSFRAETYRVFIASPLDLGEEREAAAEAIKNMPWPWSPSDVKQVSSPTSSSIFLGA